MRANPEIDALLAELLDSGVSPKYVCRLASELEDHCTDLEAEAERLGVPENDAALDARLRLGDCSAIAEEFERRPELKSWIYRSRWLERALRVLGAAYLLLRAPARMVADGQTVMLRYTAATAAGAGVTCAILLMLTLMMSPESVWGVRLVEHAGAALGAWEVEPPRRRAGRRVLPSPASIPPVAEPSEPDTAPSARDTEPSARDIEPSARDPEPSARDPEPSARDPEPSDNAVEPRAPAAPWERGGSASLRESSQADEHTGTDPSFFRRRFARSEPLLRPVEWRLPQRLRASNRPAFEHFKVRVILAELQPSLHLGIGDHEFKPIIEAPPSYPSLAARRGLEGHVVVEYTVTRTGIVRDPVVIESSHPVFNRAALDAAATFRYRPRTIRGQAVDVRGVRITIRFELEA